MSVARSDCWYWSAGQSVPTPGCLTRGPVVGGLRPGLLHLHVAVASSRAAVSPTTSASPPRRWRATAAHAAGTDFRTNQHFTLKWNPLRRHHLDDFGVYRPTARESCTGAGLRSAAQRAFFVARLRGGVNSSAIAAIADGTRR
ncbi:hypothetical protein M2302_004298 [Micromonospora sp. A200]|nr:hypothetical protein [Micromonospora sp. A200]